MTIAEHGVFTKTIQFCLFPHARGNQHKQSIRGSSDGPIPACAGEPLRLGGAFLFFGAYPRMRGGTKCEDYYDGNQWGLSPHARGNLQHLDHVIDHAGPIPACAGEPGPGAPGLGPRGAYPRMRGGT